MSQKHGMKDAHDTNLPVYQVTVLCFFGGVVANTRTIDGIYGVAKPFKDLKEKQ